MSEEEKKEKIVMLTIRVTEEWKAELTRVAKRMMVGKSAFSKMAIERAMRECCDTERK